MKYPPTPFLPALCIRRRMHILNEQRERKDLDPLTRSASIACTLLNSLASLFATPLVCFQSFAASFPKTPGVGWGCGFLCETSAFSASLRYRLQPLPRCLFFNNLQIAPSPPSICIPRIFI